MSRSPITERPRLPPLALLEVLVAEAKHPTKRRNLQRLHEVCSRRHKALSANWSYQAVARDAEAVGFLTEKSITLPSARHYRWLIDAWRDESQAFASRKPQGKTSDWTESIADEALRMIFLSNQAEIRELRSQLSIARKYQEPVTVYLSKLDPEVLEASGPSKSLLVPSELSALRRAVSSSHHSSVGWVEGNNGQVINDDGIEVLPAGFLPGLRKLLEKL